MNCNEIQALLSTYMDGALTKKEEKEVRAHLAACPACQKKLAHLSVLHKTIRAIEAPPVPEGLCERVIAAATAPPPKKKGTLISLPKIFSSWQTYSLAAACMLIFTVFYSNSSEHLSMTQKTSLYIAEDRPISLPATLPTLPQGPETPVLSPVPSASPHPSTILRPRTNYVPAPVEETQNLVVAAPEAASFDTESHAPMMARQMPELPVYSDAALSQNAKTISEAAPEKAATPTPKSSGSSAAKTPTPTKKPTAKTYPTVGSLVKRSITFVVDDTSADAVFQNARSGGESAVKNAFYKNGISYSTRESVIEEYAGEYNALANEANMLAQKIADGNTSLSSQLSAKEREMQALRNLCASPTLRLAYQ